MVDPTTINTCLSVPVRGSDVGTWDVPINNNFNIIDSVFGGVTALAPTNININLTSAQAQASVIRLTGTLTGLVQIILPQINKFWIVDNQLTNAPSSFCCQIVNNATTQAIGVPPGETDIFYDGTNVNFRNMGKVGEYWDYADIVPPTWNGQCTKPPWINCTGQAFSSAVYPVLRDMLGVNTVPDARGRSRFVTAQGTGRITTTFTNPNVVNGSGGLETIGLVTANLPAYTPSGTVAVSINNGTNVLNNAPINGYPAGVGYAFGTTNITGTATFTGTPQGGTGTVTTNIPPAYIGGITMIRAA